MSRIAISWAGVCVLTACSFAAAADDAKDGSTTRLTQTLESWAKNGGDLDDAVDGLEDAEVKTKAEALALCAALDALRANPKLGYDEKQVTAPLFTLAAFFQNVETTDAITTLAIHGLPRLRPWVQDAIDGKEHPGVDSDDVMFVLKILSMYGQPEDVKLIAAAARKPIDAGYIWSVVLSHYDAENPDARLMVDALRDPLPTGFIAVAYLDMVNGLAIEEKLDDHPFDTAAGRKQLLDWLSDRDPDVYSYAVSATAALPYVAQPERDILLAAAERHPDLEVQLEAAWARAETGDEAGIRKLAAFCLDHRTAARAIRYLDDLDRLDAVPAKAQDGGFLAGAKMSDWLADPREMGRHPDQVSVLDTRELFWPPANEKRTLYLIKYEYKPTADKKAEIGVGMVGSITFALFGDAKPEMSPEDLYGLHCAWELQALEDDRAPKERTPAAGRAVLREKNAGF